MTETGTLIFAWMATALLHGLVLFALAWGASALGLLRDPALRQGAWRAVLLVPALSAALQLAIPGALLRWRLPAESAPAVATVAPTSSAAAAPAPAASPVFRIEPLLRQAPPALGWAWLGWAAFAACLIAARRLRLRRYRRGLEPVADPAALAMAEGLRRRAGLKRLELLTDTHLSSPIALCPAIVVLPAWAPHELSPVQLEALLAHEVRHLARRDPQWRTLTRLAALVLPAPHAALVLRRLDALSEEACDAWSAAQIGAGAPLAECLAACVQHGLGRGAPVLAAAMARPGSEIVERARRLLSGDAQGFEPRPWRERAVAAGALVLAVGALPGFAAALPRPVAAPAPAVRQAEPAREAAMARPASRPAPTLHAGPALADARPGPTPVVAAVSAQPEPRPAAIAAAADAAVPAAAAVAATLAEPADRALPAIPPPPPAPPLPPAPPAPPPPPPPPVAPMPPVPPVPPLPPAPPQLPSD